MSDFEEGKMHTETRLKTATGWSPLFFGILFIVASIVGFIGTRVPGIGTGVALLLF